MTMKKKLKFVVTFVWFSYLIVSSILLFSRGFLLTRTVQDNNSTCSSKLDPFCDSNENVGCLIKKNETIHTHFHDAFETCINPSSKVILLIVDALRFDFTIYDEHNDKPLPYQNKLPIIKDTMRDFPESTRLFKFIADPPTTTMQRLKALTTGSLPTFIDAGSNFATSEINEDNIIDQIVKNNYSTVFMGDDTWASLYPNRFLRNYPFPSFDVWDLDTVDSGVKTSIFPELEKNDWNLLIGHFLGVDHCGHRYGPNHIEMARKLTEINYIIKDIIDKMANDTILFVIGDHGMTITGDHGGESTEEVTAAMFVHSKRPLLSYGGSKDTVKQVDIVPTLSAILGVPIPFQNLGILIYDALPSTDSDSWKLPLFWLWNNVQQVVHYIKIYSESAKIFDKDYLELYHKEYDTLHQQIDAVHSHEDFLKFSGKSVEFLEKLRMLCEEVWIQFDVFSISNGLTFLFLSIFFMYIICDGIPLQYLSRVIENSFISVLCLVLISSTISILIVEMSKLAEGISYSFIFVANVVSPLMFLIPIFQCWEFICSKWYKRKLDAISFICRLILVFNVLVPFSNSFINEEASILLFMLVTIFLTVIFSIGWFKKGFSKKSIIKPLLSVLIILSLLRATMYFWRCRVEQQWCFDSPHDVRSQLKSQPTKAEWCLAVLSLLLLINIAKVSLRHSGNLSGYTSTQFIAKIVPMVLVVLVAGYWVLQRFTPNKKPNKRNLNYLPLTIYVLSSISLINLVMKPLCITVIFRDDDYLSQEEALIPSIFNKLKSNMEKSSRRVPIICGLGTAYSAVYVILAVHLLIIFALLLGDGFGFSACIMIVVAVFLLLITSIMRIKQAETLDDLLNIPTIAVLGWVLVAQYFFFATGHQPAFPNITWDAAFIGTTGLFSHRYILGVLIIINTFGTYIITGLLLPLLVIAPFCLFIMMPSLVAKNKSFFGQIQKGEMILYERSKLVSASMFTLCCKYILIYGIKVFTSMLAATIHCRHLMVWNVFAPKFIFEGVALIVTTVSVLLGYLLFVRIHHKIETYLDKLNKTN
ncbi:phosphatidylinositol glycan anchor biosynthesis class O [Rhynchophorus ferrugineus]|uniref:phosphatidylinositol glycan anchor biosynthesis class O n=1 Tax=Rhynchophorus ferrugineus TaxID=354439 RepID=UPI003FCC94E8